MSLLFVIPLFLIGLWLFAETKTDVLRRLVCGGLALISLFCVCALVFSPPKVRSARHAAFRGLEQALRAGDAKSALAALEAYHAAPNSAWGSDATATFELVRTLKAAKRNQPK